MIELDGEDEIAKLRIELNKSRRKLKFVSYGLVSAILIFTVLLIFVCEWYQWDIEACRFYFYYSGRDWNRYGVDDLEFYLDRWKWGEGTYVAGKFDCSEMSAFIEWKLESEAYHTMIIVGQAPWNKSASHAWLLVETSQGKYMPVEATQFKLVKWDDPYFDLYFEYHYSFETLFDALDYDYDSFNWWEV